MDPTREPRSLSDDAIVARLRAGAPGLPAVRYDGRSVRLRARAAARRLRRRRIRTGAVALSGAAAAYLTLALAGPVPVPGVGPVSVPGGAALRALVGGVLPPRPPAPDQWSSDVERLDAEVVPVVERLQIDLYLSRPGCRVFEYARGDYRDGDPDCQDLAPFDAPARADFAEVTAAVERSGVAVERITRYAGAIHVPLREVSWRYNWEYVHLPGATVAPATRSPGEQWTHIRGEWWFHRTHDD
jgi:hypothetical protein